MAELILKVPPDIREEFKMIFGEEMPDETWQLLLSRFSEEELREKLQKIKRIESIVSKSKLTEEQARELADEVSLSLARRYERLLKGK